jgi:glutaredoxin
MEQDKPKLATVYRMVMPDHLCPFGVKSVWLLRRQGYAVDDRHLVSRDATDAFMAKHEVQTTPQTFIDGKRVGGYDDLRKYFGLRVRDPEGTSYQPVVAVFAVAALLSLALTWTNFGTLASMRTLEWFASISMSLLAMLKLQDLESFSTMFLNYDLLARRWVTYAYLYPFAELVAGVSMAADVIPIVSVPLAISVGSIGAASVTKAVYVDRRELTCACVGGGSRVPLGFVSLTENLMMLAMGIWMWAKAIGG